MNCPVCAETLERLPYEGIPIFHCRSCHGHVLYPDQVDAVKRRHTLGEESLTQESQRLETEPSHQRELRCPRCRGPMKAAPSSRHSTVVWDYCHLCDLVWLDAGELAKIQLEKESSLQDHEYQTMREHWRQNSTAKLSRFQRQLAARAQEKLPEESTGWWARFLDLIFLRDTPRT